MFKKTLVACALCVVALLSVSAGAADTPARGVPGKPAESASKPALTGQLVKTGLFLFTDGSNSVLRLSADGLIVVDGPAPGNYDAFRKLVKKISDQPVRVLINTDHHAEHTASNARFLADGAQILAHENVTKNLASVDTPGGRIAPPTKTYDRDITVPIGGVEVRVMHFGNARTNGDSVVYFPNLRVVAVGDLYAATPSPDYSSGGSMVGWGPVLAEVLRLDFDVVVPGTGPTVTRADLEAFKVKIDTLVSRAAGLVQKGVPKDQLTAELETEDLGWRFTFTGAQLDGFYAELSRTGGQPGLSRGSEALL